MDMNPTEPFDSDDNKELSRQDVERARTRMLLDKATNLLSDNPSKVQREYPEGNGKLVEQDSVIVPTEEDMTLYRLGYSKIEVGNLLEYTADGSLVYPVVTAVTTYDTDNNERDAYLITEESAITVTVGMEDAENTHAIGFAVDDGGLTMDIMQFDSDQLSGFIPGRRPLTSQEELALLSVLDVSNTTLQNQRRA